YSQYLVLVDRLHLSGQSSSGICFGPNKLGQTLNFWQTALQNSDTISPELTTATLARLTRPGPTDLGHHEEDRDSGMGAAVVYVSAKYTSQLNSLGLCNPQPLGAVNFKSCSLVQPTGNM
ncbi:Protein of unknown function, partial [Cotesia congregata]